MTFTLARCHRSDITCAPLLLNAVIFLVLLNLTILVGIALRDYRNRDPETRRIFFRFGKYHDFRSSKFAVTGHAPKRILIIIDDNDFYPGMIAERVSFTKLKRAQSRTAVNLALAEGFAYRR